MLRAAALRSAAARICARRQARGEGDQGEDQDARLEERPGGLSVAVAEATWLARQTITTSPASVMIATSMSKPGGRQRGAAPRRESTRYGEIPPAPGGALASKASSAAASAERPPASA